MAPPGAPALSRASLVGSIYRSAISTGVGFGIGAALAPALQPYTQSLTNATWSLHPAKPLSAADAAEATIRDLLSVPDGEIEAKKTGIGATRFGVLRGLAGEPPGPQQLLELWNRDVISSDRVDDGLKQSRMRPEWYAAFKKLARVLPSVSDLVRFAVREVFSPSQRDALDLDAEFPQAFADRAAQLGLTEEDARNYWAAHWELPSYTQGAQMLFRGDLTQAQFDGLLKALDYAPTWRDKLANIARVIPSTTDMIRFAVREVYNPTQRAALDLDSDYPTELTGQLAKHGVSEDDAHDWWAAHWRLPSPEQGYQMLWRGEITDAQLNGLLKAQDYAPTWRPKLKAIAYHVPGRIDLRRMFAAHIIDYPELVTGYEHLGYTHQDAVRLADLAQALTSGTGASHVGKAQTQLWTTTHRSFIAGESDDPTATTALTAAGVPAGQVPDVLELWKAERELIRKQLTPAQIKKAYNKGEVNHATEQVWTRDEAMAELIQRGYNTTDAENYLDL